jgi:hypothetical protein
MATAPAIHLAKGAAHFRLLGAGLVDGYRHRCASHLDAGDHSLRTSMMWSTSDINEASLAASAQVARIVMVWLVARL